MYRIILITLILLATAETGGAQTQRKLVDSLTWDLYSSGKWELLLNETNKSLHKGIDFYYLRVRAGVAAYETKKYRLAVSHFRKAREANQQDDFLNQYFYWALVYSGREDEALGLKNGFKEPVLDEMHLRKGGLFTAVSSESLVTLNRDYSRLHEEPPGNSGGESAYRSLFRDQFYQGFSVDMHLAPRLNLFHNISGMQVRRIIQTNNHMRLPENYLEPSALQFQYFLGGRYFAFGGWDFHSSISYIWGNYDYYYPSATSSAQPELAGFQSKIGDFVVSAGLDKDMTCFKPGLTAGYAEINGFRQVQGNARLVFYPFKNPNFYLVSEASLHWDESTGDLEMVYHPQVGLKTGPFWLSGEYSLGKMKNYFTGGGLVVYNIPETIIGKWHVSLWLPLLKDRCELTLKYQQTEKEGMTFVSSDQLNYISEAYDFTDQSFLISMRWKF